VRAGSSRRHGSAEDWWADEERCVNVASVREGWLSIVTMHTKLQPAIQMHKAFCRETAFTFRGVLPWARPGPGTNAPANHKGKVPPATEND